MLRVVRAKHGRLKWHIKIKKRHFESVYIQHKETGRCFWTDLVQKASQDSSIAAGSIWY